MMTTQQRQILGEAMATWGPIVQQTKAIEELSELIQVLAKRLNSNPNVTKEQIVDEIADVLIVAEQLRMHYGDCDVGKRVDYKLDRMEKALAKLRTVGVIS